MAGQRLGELSFAVDAGLAAYACAVARIDAKAASDCQQFHLQSVRAVYGSLTCRIHWPLFARRAKIVQLLTLRSNTAASGRKKLRYGIPNAFTAGESFSQSLERNLAQHTVLYPP
ncbi:MAG TPA: hypothetical protein DDW52_01325 [Planctomycetaceae bacterium]|nr:hypothetical protein [Planctomycetaceae bacterium]